MKHEIDIEATTENLPGVLEFIEENLAGVDCSPRTMIQINVAVEEIFMNIAHYAYAPGTGRVIVRLEIDGEPAMATITFIDRGVPYDPLAKADPDVTLSAQDREIGGLGIYMVKKTMDSMTYEYKDGQNILKLQKKL